MKRVFLFTILVLLLPGITLALPIGDAPLPYPYAEHDDGIHEYLGSQWLADDGISWTNYVPGTPIDITITVNTQWGDFEWLKVWIDWDLSGSWESDELVVSYEDYWFGPGENEITENVMVPGGASAGPVWLRARLSFEDVGPEGLAWYGEVEDYEIHPPADPVPVEYRFGDPPPGYDYGDWPFFRAWLEVRLENQGDGDAYNVTATITGWPENVTIIDGDVALGDIPAGSSAWSAGDNFELVLDMLNPHDKDEIIYWRIEYDDASGIHHVIEDVPEFRTSAKVKLWSLQTMLRSIALDAKEKDKDKKPKKPKEPKD